MFYFLLGLIHGLIISRSRLIGMPRELQNVPIMQISQLTEAINIALYRKCSQNSMSINRKFLLNESRLTGFNCRCKTLRQEYKKKKKKKKKTRPQIIDLQKTLKLVRGVLRNISRSLKRQKRILQKTCKYFKKNKIRQPKTVLGHNQQIK